MRYSYFLAIACFFSISPSLVFAQLTLERQYPNEEVEVVELQNRGSNYAVPDLADEVVRLYDSNHQFWRSFSTEFPVGSYPMSISLVSDRLFNANDELEYLIRYRPSTSSTIARCTVEVRSEQGQPSDNLEQRRRFNGCGEVTLPGVQLSSTLLLGVSKVSGEVSLSAIVWVFS